MTDPSCDRGDVMIQVVVAAPFLLAGLSALVSAGQYLETAQTAGSVASAAARAAAEPSVAAVRAGRDPTLAERTERARTVIDESGLSRGGPVEVAVEVEARPDGGPTVTVTVRMPVAYALPAFGMPAEVAGSASAVALEAVTEADPSRRPDP